LAVFGVVIVNTFLLARFLGPQNYGTYFIFIRIVSLLAIVADLGLSQTANAFVGRHEEWIARVNVILLSFAGVFSAGSIILGATVYRLAGPRLLPGFSWTWMGMAFGVLPLSLYASFWNSMMIGLGRIWLLNLVRLASNILSLVLTVIFVVFLAGRAETAAAIYLAAMAVQFLVMFAMVFRLGPRQISIEPPADLSGQMLRFGLRGHPGAILYIFWTQLPVFALNAVHGATVVGVFSVAQQIVDKVPLPVQAFQDVIYRKMAMLSREAATFAMNRYLRVTWWGMWSVALLGIAIVPWLIVWFLPAYAGAAQVSRILFLGTAFMSISMLLDAYFINQLRRPGLTSILAGINLAMSLIMTAILVSPLAQIGAAWTLVVTQILGTAIMLYLYHRITRASLFQLARPRREDVNLARAQLSSLMRSTWNKE
jgi:O-antigen/teichoic acid export membrane protein